MCVGIACVNGVCVCFLCVCVCVCLCLTCVYFEM